MNRTQSVARLPAPVHNPAGVVVGEVDRSEDGRVWLEKHQLNPDRHMWRDPRGWALAVTHLHSDTGGPFQLHMTQLAALRMTSRSTLSMGSPRVQCAIAPFYAARGGFATPGGAAVPRRSRLPSARCMGYDLFTSDEPRPAARPRSRSPEPKEGFRTAYPVSVAASCDAAAQ